MKTCPQCGAEPGRATFCPSCGNRVTGRARGDLANFAIAIAAALVATGLLIVGASFALCGATVTISAVTYPWPLGAYLLGGPGCLVVGVVLLRLMSRLMRAGEAHTSGHRTRTFGK